MPNTIRLSQGFGAYRRTTFCHDCVFSLGFGTFHLAAIAPNAGHVLVSSTCSKELATVSRVSTLISKVVMLMKHMLKTGNVRLLVLCMC